VVQGALQRPHSSKGMKERKEEKKKGKRREKVR
jgi:hypothetical protein